MSTTPSPYSNDKPYSVIDLEVSDLIVGRVYTGPDKSGLVGLEREPLSKLLFAVDPETNAVVTALKKNGERSPVRLTNAGGIRRSKSLKNTEVKSGVALVSTSKEPDWQDEVRVIDGVRHFMYYGDSRKPGDPTKVVGNAELLNVYNKCLADKAARAVTPLFLAFKNTTGNPFEYEFLGIAVPGSPVLPENQWTQPYTARNEDKEEFSNYKYVFTLLDCQKVDGVWVRAAFFGLDGLLAIRSPQKLRDWVASGWSSTPNPICALGAEEETMEGMVQASKQNADDLVRILRSRLFAGNLSAVNPETPSGEIYKNTDFVDGSWYDVVMSLVNPTVSEPQVVVLLGGPGNGKSALAQCLIAAAKEQKMNVAPGSTTEGARRIIDLRPHNGDDGAIDIRIVNDASIPVKNEERLHDVLKWVAADPQSRKALLCVNRGALVEEAAGLVRSNENDGAAILRSLGGGKDSRATPLEVKVKVIEMDKESTLEKMINDNNRGPWGVLVGKLKNSFAVDADYQNSVFHCNAEELDMHLFGFYGVLLEAERHRGLKMTYRDIWSAVGAFLIGSESAREYTNPRDVLSSGDKLRDFVGYCALYGHGWQTEKVVVDVATLSPVEEALRTTDPAAKVTADMCANAKIETVLNDLYIRYPSLVHEETSTLALKTAIAYRMQHLRTRSASYSREQEVGDVLNSSLATFGYLKDAEKYAAGFNVLGKPKKNCNGAGVANKLNASARNGVVSWNVDAGCGVTVHASSDFLAAAALCTETQIGLRAESTSYVHTLDRVGRAHSLKLSPGPSDSNSDSDSRTTTPFQSSPVDKLQVPQQIPLPEMLIADVLIAPVIGYTYKNQTTKSKDNRVFLDKDRKGKNIESERPDHLGESIKSQAGIEHWSDLSAPSRLRGSGAGALPLTPHLAIMQRQRDKLPNFAAILEYIYQKGLESLQKSDAATTFEDLAIVTTRILQKNSATHIGLREIEESLGKHQDKQGKSVYGIRGRVTTSPRDMSTKLPMPTTPYEWFVVSLASLDRLAGKIPPVVCAEWLTAVYRTSFGMGYLCAYTTEQKSHSKKDDLFSWTSSERSVGERTVLGALRKLVSAGKPWDTSAKNRYEAVCYMLQSLSADDRLYMLTKSSGKASGVPEPGLGWVDMVVMLAAEVVSGGDDTIELYYVHEYIKALRVQPPMAELIRLCTRNGILTAAVPPDADGAMQVYRPYTLVRPHPVVGPAPETQPSSDKESKDTPIEHTAPGVERAAGQDRREAEAKDTRERRGRK